VQIAVAAMRQCTLRTREQLHNACRSTPWKITTLGVLFLSAAAGATILLPDESTSEVVTRLLITIVLSGGGIAALVGASLVFDIQKEN
jgi:Protein of unknown function (DUF1118)